MSIQRLLAAVAVVACMAVGPLAAAGPEDTAEAAAESWLKLVDAGEYATSWEQAAKLFQGAVKQADWVQMVNGVRTPLGKVMSRKVESREYTEKLSRALRERCQHGLRRTHPSR